MNIPDSSRASVTVELSGEVLALLGIRRERAERMHGGEVSLAEVARLALEEHLLGCAKRD